jgi:hypothetical protein
MVGPSEWRGFLFVGFLFLRLHQQIVAQFNDALGVINRAHFTNSFLKPFLFEEMLKVTNRKGIRHQCFGR